MSGNPDPSTAGPLYLASNVFIYAFEGAQPWATAAARLLGAVVRSEMRAVTSELTLAECLTKPFQLKRQADVDLYCDAIRSQGGFEVLPITREVLMLAAKLRAEHGCRLPDAIHLATAVSTGCSAFITNDERLQGPAGLRIQALASA